MYTRKYLSVVILIVFLAYIGAQLKVSAGADKVSSIESQTGNRRNTIESLLATLDEPYVKDENVTVPNLKQLRIRILHNKHDTMELLFQSTDDKRFELKKEGDDLVVDALENVVLEGERLGFHIKYCENDEKKCD